MRGMYPHINSVTSNRIQQLVRIAQEALIPAPQYGEACFRKFQIALGVLDLPQGVDAAIEFDHQLQFGAQEIRDRSGHRHLTAEFQSLEVAAPQHRPKSRLGSRHVRAKATGLPGPISGLVHRRKRPPHPTRCAGHLLPRWGEGSR